MLNILFIVFLSFTSAQSFGGNAALNFQLPQGEFKDAGVTTGFGGDFNGMFYVVDQLAFGINLGFSVYDISSREVPFNYFTDLITITETTTNSIGYGHLFTKIVPFKAKVQPYMVALIGIKNLNTVTELRNNNCVDNEDTEHDDCEIASSTNASENAWSWGMGGGLEIPILELDGEEDTVFGDLLFFIDCKYLWGSRTKYLKKGSIEFSDPEDGPVTTTFNWSESATDLFQINIGLAVKVDI